MSHKPFNKKTSNLVWITLGIALILGIGTIAYFAWPKNNPETLSSNPNIQYLPHEAEAQTKINQIKTSKNIDDTQATIEFLTAYVPHIKWWEINSLSELEEKIKLINNQTGFPPFKEVPQVDKFNQEFGGSMQKKNLMFFTSIIPRQADNTPDWKGIKDFQNYMLTVMKPIIEGIKFKPAFATQENYQELTRKIKEEVNPNLASICSRFASLNSVSSLNQLTNEYSSKIFQGCIYAEAIHDELGEQLGISNHQEFKMQKTGNQSSNYGWRIALIEFAFLQI